MHATQGQPYRLPRARPGHIHAWCLLTQVLNLIQSQCTDMLLLKTCRRAGLRVPQTCRPSTMGTLSAGGVPGAADGPARDWPVQPHNRAQPGAPGHTCAAGGVPCPLQVPLQSLWAAGRVNARPEGLGRKPGSPGCLPSGSGQRAPAQQARGLHLLERGSWRGLRTGPMHCPPVWRWCMALMPRVLPQHCW